MAIGRVFHCACRQRRPAVETLWNYEFGPSIVFEALGLYMFLLVCFVPLSTGGQRRPPGGNGRHQRPWPSQGIECSSNNARSPKATAGWGIIWGPEVYVISRSMAIKLQLIMIIILSATTSITTINPVAVWTGDQGTYVWRKSKLNKIRQVIYMKMWSDAGNIPNACPKHAPSLHDTYLHKHCQSMSNACPIVRLTHERFFLLANRSLIGHSCIPSANNWPAAFLLKYICKTYKQ